MSPRAKKSAGKSASGLENQQKLDFSTLFASEPSLNKLSYTVSELTEMLEEAIEEHPVLGGSLIVQGELSNVKRSSRGHVYFTLKDASASIGGILWASTASRLNFNLEDGLEVYLTGRLEIYRPSGTYSVVGSKIEPVGIGALQLAFQQIKERLEAEGLFMEEFKKELPEFPERIGLITSSTGAVIHDMLRVIRRKNPLVHVLLHPVKVQGEGAADEIAAAIQELNHSHYGLDALILARGGGSFEDLFCFSEEAVVRAVFESTVPIVTGIGHEPDYALADAAADYSCSTPTAAADHLVPDIALLRENHELLVRDLLENMAENILYYEQTLDHGATRLVELHESCLETCGTRLEQKKERLLSQFELVFQKKEQNLSRPT
jgi:exodeoxyribonuclease VII large subunit